MIWAFIYITFVYIVAHAGLSVLFDPYPDTSCLLSPAPTLIDDSHTTETDKLCFCPVFLFFLVIYSPVLTLSTATILTFNILLPEIFIQS